MPETGEQTPAPAQTLEGSTTPQLAPALLVLPPDGTRVRAVTIPSIEYDREAEEVEGILYTIPSPFGPPPNCWVEGFGVDPATVRAVAPLAAPAPPGESPETAPAAVQPRSGGEDGI